MTEPQGMSVVLDCRDPEALALFWSGALGYATLGAAGNYVLLAPESGPGPKLLLQRVPEPKAGKNRMHFDLHASDIEALATSLVALGAHRVSEDAMSEHGSSWIVLSDPEGNEFCVCNEGT
jgi:predicted enzyme related to lactoylglutathione lyase